MRDEIKTAAIMGAIIVAGVVAIGVYFGSLDESESLRFSSQEDKSGLKKAPQLYGISGYINTDEAINEYLEGKVVLYDIWTYSCINCQRTMPFLTAWDAKYADKGLVIVGIHTPEFEFEKDVHNVRRAVEKFGIEYPVVLDNDKTIWNAFENRYWPRKYIADHEGYIRYNHIGEGAYDETERVIQALLDERSSDLRLGITVALPLVDIEQFEHETRTPELYFGYKFAQWRSQIGNSEGFSPEQSVRYSIPDRMHENYFYLDGTWKNLEDRMTLVSESGRIILPYYAKQVNIVASGQAMLQVFVDGSPIDAGIAGSDIVQGNSVFTLEPTLYNLVDSDKAANHVIEIQVSGQGFEIYTFTFG